MEKQVKEIRKTFLDCISGVTSKSVIHSTHGWISTVYGAREPVKIFYQGRSEIFLYMLTTTVFQDPYHQIFMWMFGGCCQAKSNTMIHFCFVFQSFSGALVNLELACPGYTSLTVHQFSSDVLGVWLGFFSSPRCMLINYLEGTVAYRRKCVFFKCSNLIFPNSEICCTACLLMLSPCEGLHLWKCNQLYFDA